MSSPAPAAATTSAKQENFPLPTFTVGTTSHAIHFYGKEDQFRTINNNNNSVDGSSASFIQTEFAAIPQLNPMQRNFFSKNGIPALPVRGKKYILPSLIKKQKSTTTSADGDADDTAFVVNFWPLLPRVTYEILVSFKDSESGKSVRPPLTMSVTTKQTMLNSPSMIIVNSKEIMENPGITDLILASDEDYLIMLEQDIEKNIEFLNKLFWNALFILPHEDSILSSLPNGKKRFCINLDNPKADWLGSRKVKKYLKDFELVITNDFKKPLLIAGDIFDETKGSTWITKSFVDTLQKMAKIASTHNNNNNSNGDNSSSEKRVQCMAFILRERSKRNQNNDNNTNDNEDAADDSKGKDENEIVAATFGFSLGKNYHDYTMTTLCADHRSAGTLVTKLTGYILQQLGFVFWYWGNKIGYMGDYYENEKYGGVDLDRKAFYEKWNKFREMDLEEKNVPEAVKRICAKINLPVSYEFS